MRKQGALLLTLLFAITLTHNIQHTNPELASASQQGTHETYLPIVSIPEDADWPTVAANPQRTSWTAEEVADNNLQVVWYRPIEGYIPQNVQIITSQGLLYISTANGLYALNAHNGAVAWRFDTELPLGNSPTVADGIVYVGGYDRKLHALDATTGDHLWAFTEAEAGYDTNPLVIDGKVVLGNRDGNMYAIGAHNTPQAGQLLWKYQAGGPIHLTAAYHDGIVYFAAGDNHAYALDANTGQLIWKSSKLPGEQYQSYWPVVYQDKVIFSAASSYRTNKNPGTLSVEDTNGNGYMQHYYMDRDDLFGDEPDGTIIGEYLASPPAWANGNSAIDASRLTEYLENNPGHDALKHKPWRRTLVVLNQSDGSEYTFDSDNDGYQEYAPFSMWGTQSGNRYPPIVGNDSILYVNNIFKKHYISQGQVMGWNLDTPNILSILGLGGAVDEPQAISAGGNFIYRSICCDRAGSLASIDGNSPGYSIWHYNKTLDSLAPNYDVMWEIMPELSRLRGWYKGTTNSINGIYHNHGDQNPIIPYQGMLFIHRSNAIIAFGPEEGPGYLPILQIKTPNTTETAILTESELLNRLENEIQKILDAGYLRPGYYNQHAGFFLNELSDYFVNPGDTLYTLTRAYPYLTTETQIKTEVYLKEYFETYFGSTMYSRIGWSEGAPRDAVLLPPEVVDAMSNSVKTTSPQNDWAWNYPQINFYALWLYAEIFPEDASNVYEVAKQELEIPVTKSASFFIERPWQLNGYIAGYIGFLNLQETSGMSTVDAQLRANILSELDRLLQMRVDIFSKDLPWPPDDLSKFNYRSVILSRNFILLVPELGEYLNDHIPTQTAEAINEYEMIAPYWFVTRFNAVPDEGTMQNLYDHHAIFQAKAYILQESRAELTPYIDAPAFLVGDLFYIQNLIAALDTP